MNSISIGRREDCDIVIEAESASRLHAELVRRDQKLFIRDKNSTNGTFVERDGIKREVKGEFEVLVTDRVSFGSSDFFLLERLLHAFSDRLFLRANEFIEVQKKESKKKDLTATRKVSKYRCPSCGAIVLSTNETCESCYTQL